MSVSAIIPAYNEESYLGGVLEVLASVSAVSQVIVVSDGSTDATVDIALEKSASYKRIVVSTHISLSDGKFGPGAGENTTIDFDDGNQ